MPVEGVLKLFPNFSPAKPRNISIFEQKAKKANESKKALVGFFD